MRGWNEFPVFRRRRPASRRFRGDESFDGDRPVRPRRHDHHRERELSGDDGLSAWRDRGTESCALRRSARTRRRGLLRFLGRSARGKIPPRGIQAHCQIRKAGMDSGDLHSVAGSLRQAVSRRQVRDRDDSGKARRRFHPGPDRRHSPDAGGDRIRDRRLDRRRQREFPGDDGLSSGGNRGTAPFVVRRSLGAQYRRLSRLLDPARRRRSFFGPISAHRQGRPRSLDPGLLQSDLRSSTASRSKSSNSPPTSPNRCSCRIGGRKPSAKWTTRSAT